MIKLYFRKIFSIIICSLAIFFVYYLAYMILGLIFSFFKALVIRYSILMGIPTFIVLRFVYKSRFKNQNYKIDYIKYMRENKEIKININIKDEFCYLKNFDPFKAEVLAASTIVLPFIVAMLFSIENEASVFLNIFASLIIFVLITAIYSFLDFAFWILVHKSWINNTVE